MCARCDETAELLKLTKGMHSGDFTYVEFTFPGGKPELTRGSDDRNRENSSTT